MSAVVRGIEDEDGEGRPIWRLTLSCGHQTSCFRHSPTPPTSRPGPCRGCKVREKDARKYQRRKVRQQIEREAEAAKPTEGELAFEAKIKVLMTIE
jgi:hypothetical protein